MVAIFTPRITAEFPPSHIYACVHTDINTVCNFSHEIVLTGFFEGFLGKQESRLHPPPLFFHFSLSKEIGGVSVQHTPQPWSLTPFQIAPVFSQRLTRRAATLSTAEDWNRAGFEVLSSPTTPRSHESTPPKDHRPPGTVRGHGDTMATRRPPGFPSGTPR